MGFRELLLVVLASTLFSLLILNINVTSQRNHDALRETEITHTAISIAQRFIEEAKSKKYDANVGLVDPSTFPSGFTDNCCLGPSVSESYPYFDDVDDYTGFNETITVKGMDFQVQISVFYVHDNNPEQQELGAKTFFKKMTVNVSSVWLSNSLTLKHIFSYFGLDNT